MGKTVMIADDSVSVRQMVGFTLKGAGFDVIESVDGSDALNKLGANSPDLLITDLNMPNMDGLSLIRKIRTQARFKFMPILMLTTESQADKKQEGRAAGATGWIVKPFHPEQLVGLVKRVLG